MHKLIYPTCLELCTEPAGFMDSTIASLARADNDADLPETFQVIRDDSYRVLLANGTVCYRSGRELAEWYRDVKGIGPHRCCYRDDSGARCGATRLIKIDCDPRNPLDGKYLVCPEHIGTVLREVFDEDESTSILVTLL